MSLRETTERVLASLTPRERAVLAKRFPEKGAAARVAEVAARADAKFVPDAVRLTVQVEQARELLTQNILAAIKLFETQVQAAHARSFEDFSEQLRLELGGAPKESVPSPFWPAATPSLASAPKPEAKLSSNDAALATVSLVGALAAPILSLFRRK